MWRMQKPTAMIDNSVISLGSGIRVRPFRSDFSPIDIVRSLEAGRIGHRTPIGRRDEMGILSKDTMSLSPPRAMQGFEQPSRKTSLLRVAIGTGLRRSEPGRRRLGHRQNSTIESRGAHVTHERAWLLRAPHSSRRYRPRERDVVPGVSTCIYFGK
jgi:hypothetical protein